MFDLNLLFNLKMHKSAKFYYQNQNLSQSY